MSKSQTSVDDLLPVVRDAGYVVLREKSYRQAQERQRVAEALRVAEAEQAEHARQWALNCLAEERRLRDRLEFVYGVARAHGVTVAELSQEVADVQDARVPETKHTEG